MATSLSAPRRSGATLLLLPPLLGALMLGGCVKFGAAPPKSLLTVTPTSTVAPGTVTRGSAGTVTIIEPDVPKSLDTVRVAVRTDSNDFAYVKDAVWADTPKNLFRAVLAETVAARTGMLVLDAGQFSADPGRRVMGELVAFGMDAASGQAVVTFDASVIGKGGSVTKRRFSATAPAGRIDARTVAPAIQNAANQVAVEVADWLATGVGS